MSRSILLAAAAAFALSACAASSDMEAEAAPSDMAPTQRDAFVQMAASSDLYEIQSGELARSRSQNAAVREFARILIEHHTQTTQQIRAAAKAAGMIRTHDWMLPPPMQQILDELRAENGAGFDRLFLRQQVQAHESALVLHSNYAKDGDTPALRVVAAAAAPIVQQHLDRARQLD